MTASLIGPGRKYEAYNNSYVDKWLRAARAVRATFLYVERETLKSSLGEHSVHVRTHV